MESITIENVPDELYERIQQAALSNRRTMNKQIILCLERNFGMHTDDVQMILERTQQLRAKTAHYYLTDEALLRAKNEGRP